MAAVPFHYLDVRAFCYATEDESRVESALRTLLPQGVPLERARSSGHHGDPITILSSRVETTDEIRTVLDRVQTMAGLETVVDAIEDRVDDDCSFFLRLDKQRAFDGDIVLGTGIHFRGKVETYPATRKGAIENLREYFDEVT